MSDFDWTDHGTAEDHADRVEGVGSALGKDGRYVDAKDMHIAAQCIRYLSAKAEVLEKENEAAEKEIEALRKSIEEYDRMLAACDKDGADNAQA